MLDGFSIHLSRLAKVHQTPSHTIPEIKLTVIATVFAVTIIINFRTLLIQHKVDGQIMWPLETILPVREPWTVSGWDKHFRQGFAHYRRE